MSIKENYQKIRREIPEHVTLVVAAKTRTKEEILELIAAGAADIGENYVQEAQQVYSALGNEAKKLRWHMIGHLQTNKINKVLSIFDVIQTVDSYKKAQAIDKRAEAAGRNIVPVYIEINIGSEFSKEGIKPEEHKPFEEYMLKLVEDMSKLKHLRVEGLMTMGPRSGNPEDSRPYFRQTRNLFDMLKELHLPNVNMKTLSMGMSNSYKIAIEEGSNMVRLGTIVFGERKYC
ncbi:MAG: YggS family pyridoxal phosphate-dependent enzyme [Nanoarchaeota archaeon]|nr:YggS family pyridoxal phosphate-dependent enzyme [Nanoarchaeota archaeon]